MTKKFWKDWQNRIGETTNILLRIAVFNTNNGACYCRSILGNEDKILKASFHGDAVNLIIERHWTKNGHYVVENEYLTIHRQEIKTIEFINYLKYLK